MAAIHSIPNGGGRVQTVTPAGQSGQQNQRVTESSQGIFQGIFQKTKTFITRTWNVIWLGLGTAGDKISFVVFRVLEWVHPSLGPKIENVYLRLGNIWQSMRRAGEEEETRKTIEKLQLENHELQIKTRNCDQLSQQNDILIRERNQLLQQSTDLRQAKEQAENLNRCAQQQENNILAREKAVVQSRDLLLAQQAEWAQKNTALSSENTLLKATLSDWIKKHQNLQASLEQVQKELSLLQKQLPNQQAMQEQLSKLVKASKRVPQYGQKTELDDGLETLLPQLLDQMSFMKDHLKQAQATLPKHSAALIALQSLERILGDLTPYLQNIPPALKLHSQWQSSLNASFYQQPQQQWV